MKKRIVLIVLCLAIVCLSACGAPEATTEDTTGPAATATEPAQLPTEAAETATETDAPSETEQPTEPETFAHATLSVRYAEDSLPPQGQYDTFVAEDGEAQTQIVLSTDAVVRDLKVLALTDGDFGDDGKMHFTVKERKSFDRFTPDRPLVISTVFYGLIPNNGISYVDETGTTRCFAVDMSGEDGSVYLWEFNN